MSDGVTVLALILGFGLVLIAGAKVGPSTPTFLAGLFPPVGARDWPTGVQEPDAPRFAVAHLDALRPDLRPVTAAEAMDAREVVDLYERPLDSS